MNLVEFKRSYHSAVTAIHETHVAALVASSALESFPNNLPKANAKSLKTALKDFTAALGQLPNDAEFEAEQEIRVDVNTDLNDPIAIPVLRMLLTRHLGGSDLKRIDFGAMLFAEDLVTTLAHLDAFTTDVVRTCCLREPRLLKRKRQVTWEEILEAGTWDDLMARMIDDYAFETGWKSLSLRLKHFEDEFGVTAVVSEDDLKMLESAYQLRHIIVHNAGRVSREYLLRTGRSDVTLGQALSVDATFAGSANFAAVTLCGELFIAVARKFFNATTSDLAGVWRRIDNRHS